MKRILIADDDESYQFILSRICSDSGAEVVAAGTAAAARTAIETTTFDLILLDLHFDGDNGFALISDVDSDADLRGKTVIVTAHPKIAPVFSGLPVVDKGSIKDLAVRIRKLIEPQDRPAASQETA